MDVDRLLEAAVAAAGRGAPIDLAPGFQGTVPGPGTYHLLDRMARRNVVIVSWRRDEDGTTGTWALTFDLEGRLMAWTTAR